MIAASIYDVSGRIVSVMTAPDLDTIEANVPDGGGYLFGAFAPDAVYCSNGAPVAFPEQPGDWAIWDWGAHEWTDPRDAAWFEAALAEAKVAALAQITAMRGQARLVYITDLPGQEALYIAKLEEARDYLADEYPDIAEYPLIASEVGITAPTAFEVAQIFANLNAMWKYAAGQIDAACFSAEAAVSAAESAEAVELIVAGLAAALAGSPS